MKSARQLFQTVSYLQYPLMGVGLIYALMPFVQGFQVLWPSVNAALIFFGLSVSFSSLQDTTKTQNQLSKDIWQSPVKGRRALLAISVVALALVWVGLYGYLFARSGVIKEVAMGVFSLGVGYLGVLKAAGEMFDHHRIDAHEPTI